MFNGNDSDRYLISVKIHKERFKTIESKLLIFYSEYVNKRKLIQLVDIWLYFVSSLHSAYGLTGLKAFLRSEFNCSNRFAMHYELGIDLNNKRKTYKFKSLFYIFANFLSKPLLPGAKIDSFSKKLRWRFTTWIISLIPQESDVSKKREFIDYVMEYFDNTLDGETEKLIENAVPTVFYHNPIKTLINSKLTIEVSPWSIIDFQGLERIFLIQRAITIVGSQHGGGHNGFVSEVGEDIEEELADIYYGWGLSEKLNYRQTRYPLRENKLQKKIFDRRVLWIEKGCISKWASYVWPHQHEVLSEAETIKYIANEMENSKINYFSLPHIHNQFRSNLYDGLRKNEIHNLSGRGEDVIRHNDVVIFDIVTSSLIHFCIEQEILFLFVVPRDSVINYTRNQKEWFDVMRNVNLAFYNDEKGKMGETLNNLIESNSEMPTELKNYHNEKFII